MKSPRERQPPSVRQLLQPLVFAGIIVFLVFGLFEVLDRTWLSDVSMGTLHLLHAVRGIVASLLVAVAVSWIIIKSSPGLLHPASKDQDAAVQARLADGERLRTFARWFMAMRWVAVVVTALLVFVTIWLLEWLPFTVWWPLWGVIGALSAANLVYAPLIRREGCVEILLPLQAYVDLVALTILLHFSGGVENPLSAMMIFHVIIGGILLTKRQCYWIAAAASGLFATMGWGEAADLFPHYTLQIFPHFEGEAGEVFHLAHHGLYVAARTSLQAVVLFLTAYFVTILADRMRRNERQLAAMAERALAGQELLERSLETTGAGLRVLNLDLETVWSNNRWKQWLAGSKGGKAMLDGEGSLARQTLEDGEVRVTEVVVDHNGNAGGRRVRGTQRVLQITTAPLRETGGNIWQVVELAQDITQQKQTHAKMIQAGKLAAVGKLAGQIAHEVNNPIAIISAKVRLLLEDYGHRMPAAEVTEELTKVTELADRVARIAQGLLSYCRPSPGSRTPLDLRIPIRKSLLMIEQRAAKAGVRVDDEVPETLPSIVANSNEMEQVFLNIFLNALDAMPGGGRLSVSGRVCGPGGDSRREEVELRVADTGPGIAAAIRERIFEPFFTTKEEGAGTGLGLAICAGLVRSHGGRIELDGQTTEGACFVLRFPVGGEGLNEANPGV